MNVSQITQALLRCEVSLEVAEKCAELISANYAEKNPVPVSERPMIEDYKPMDVLLDCVADLYALEKEACIESLRSLLI